DIGSATGGHRRIRTRNAGDGSIDDGDTCGERADLERFKCAGFFAGGEDGGAARRSECAGRVRAASIVSRRVSDSDSLASDGREPDGRAGELVTGDGEFVRRGAASHVW